MIKREMIYDSYINFVLKKIEVEFNFVKLKKLKIKN